MRSRLLIGSSGSPLERVRAEHVAGRLGAALGPSVEVALEVVDSAEASLAAGAVELAVRCLDHAAPEHRDHLVWGAVLRRDDPRDALVLRGDHAVTFAERLASDPEGALAAGPFAGVPQGAAVGAASGRRRAQAAWVRPDLDVQDAPGGPTACVEALDRGRFDALVLACEEVDRMGLGERIAARLPTPWGGAPGQGALGLLARVGDAETLLPIQVLEHKPTRLEADAERAVLDALGGDPAAPIAVRARADGARITLTARVLAADGSEEAVSERRGEATREGAARLGRVVARELIDRGAGRMLGWT